MVAEAAATVSVGAGVAVWPGLRNGTGVGDALANATTLGAADALARGEGEAFGVAVAFGEVDTFGDGDAAGEGDVSNADAFDDGRGDGFGGSVAGAMVTNAPGAVVADATLVAPLLLPFFPLKKCASRPPRINPAKMTTSTSGKSGSPRPPLSLGSSPEFERRRRGVSFTWRM